MTSHSTQCVKRKNAEDDQYGTHQTVSDSSLAPKRTKNASKPAADTVASSVVTSNPTEPSAVDVMAKRKKKSSHKKVVVPTPGNVTFDTSRPWLTRPQTFPASTIWLLHTHDNLEPGATGAIEWEEVANMYNDTWSHELKAGKKLNHKSLAKHFSVVKQQFLDLNPEYPAKLTYQVPVFDQMQIRM